MLIVIESDFKCYSLNRYLEHSIDLVFFFIAFCFTVNPTNVSSQEAQMRIRIEMLEKQLNGYKELNSKLEGELQTAKAMPDMSE